MNTNANPNPSSKVPLWKNKKLFWYIGLPVIVYLIYKLFYPTYWWHEKMTVTVSTPQGEVSGSAVRTIKVVYGPAPLVEIGEREITLKGEAVTVDLGDGKYLFALLGAPAGWAGVVYNNVTPDAKGGYSEMDLWASSLRGKGTFDLPSTKYPTLVTFEDINDPTSVKEVNPDDLTSSFGPGYNLNPSPLKLQVNLRHGVRWKNGCNGLVLILNPVYANLRVQPKIYLFAVG